MTFTDTIAVANRNSSSNQRFFGNGFSAAFSENPLLDFAITLQNHYYYALIGLLLPLCFLLNPSFSNNKTYWFDGFLGFLSVGVCGFFFANAETMLITVGSFRRQTTRYG